jgi:lipopolysaccharide transport system permease protein
VSRPIVSYSPDSALRTPGRLIAEMAVDVCGALRIGMRLAKRDLDAQYRQTVLGYIWVVLPILVTAGVWIVLNGAAVLRVDTGATPYWVFVLWGTVFWQAFVDALNGPLSQFQGNRVLLARVNFPKEALLVSACTQVLLTAALRIFAAALLCFVLGVALAPTGVLMLFPVLALIVLGTVIGTLLVPVGALFGDVAKIVWVLTTPLMLVSPVAYPPEGVQGVLRKVMEWNPLTPLISLARDLTHSGASAYWSASIAVAAASLAALVLGWTLYRVAVPILIEKLDA